MRQSKQPPSIANSAFTAKGNTNTTKLEKKERTRANHPLFYFAIMFFQCYPAFMSWIRRKEKNIAFEDALQDDWSRDLDVVEVPIGNRPLFYVGIGAAFLAAIVFGRVFYLGVVQANGFIKKSQANIG